MELAPVRALQVAHPDRVAPAAADDENAGSELDDVGRVVGVAAHAELFDRLPRAPSFVPGKPRIVVAAFSAKTPAFSGAEPGGARGRSCRGAERVLAGLQPESCHRQPSGVGSEVADAPDASRSRCASGLVSTSVVAGGVGVVLAVTSVCEPPELEATCEEEPHPNDAVASKPTIIASRAAARSRNWGRM